MEKKFKWYQRLNVQAGINLSLLPSGRMTWKEWAFSPEFGITIPGEVITTRTRLPESTSWEVDTKSIQCLSKEGLPKFVSRVLWIHGAVRLLGLDIGAGLYYRVNQTS